MMLGVAQRIVVPIALTLPNAPTPSALNASAGLLPWERMMTDPMIMTSSAATRYLRTVSFPFVESLRLSFIPFPSQHVHADRLLVQLVGYSAGFR